MVSWNFESPNTKKYLGANLKKAKTNHDARLKKMRDKFIADYPYAKLSEFEFWIGLLKNGDIDEENTKIVYKGDGEKRLYDEFGTRWSGSWPVTSRVFKTLYSSALYWGPTKIWDPTTTTEPFAMGKGSFDPTSFRIFVNGEQSFLFSSTLNTSWSSNVKDITKTSVDKNDPYFCSLIAAYVVSQKTGICTKHFQSSSDVHKVKSINVVLNLVVLPGLILIPSDLVLLKEKVPGYNNTLTIATKEMSFGKNDGLNFDSSLAKTEKTKVRFELPRIDADKKNKELGVVFAVLTLIGAAGAWLW